MDPGRSDSLAARYRAAADRAVASPSRSGAPSTGVSAGARGGASDGGRVVTSPSRGRSVRKLLDRYGTGALEQVEGPSKAERVQARLAERTAPARSSADYRRGPRGRAQASSSVAPGGRAQAGPQVRGGSAELARSSETRSQQYQQSARRRLHEAKKSDPDLYARSIAGGAAVANVQSVAVSAAGALVGTNVSTFAGYASKGGYGYYGGFYGNPYGYGFCPFGLYYGSSWSWSVGFGWGWGSYWGSAWCNYPWYWGWAGYYCTYYPWYWCYKSYYYPKYYYPPVVYGAAIYDYYDDGPDVIYIEDDDPEVIYVEVPAEQPTNQGVVIADPAPQGGGGGAMNSAAERYLELGDGAFREGRYADAVQFYAKAIEFEPEVGVLYLVLADALFATGDYHYAAYAVRRALKLDPTLVDGVVDKHGFYDDPAEFDRQLAVLERYLEDHPADGDARLVLAANYLFGNRPAAAVDLLEGPFAGAMDGDAAAQLILKAARAQQFGQQGQPKIVDVER